MSKLKKLLLAIVLLAVMASAAYYYVMYAGARDLTSETTDYTVSSKNLTDEFTTNTDASNKKYLEKAIAVTGKITSINKLEIIIDNTIICNLKEADNSIQKNQDVVIKGRVVGFDDMMGEIKLDQCFILKN